MMVPNLATHQANAEEWINYYYEPEVAAKLAAWVNYICPVEGAREEMEKIDPSLVDNNADLPRRRDPRADVRLHAAERRAADRVRRRLVRCHSVAERDGRVQSRDESYDGLRLRDVTK